MKLVLDLIKVVALTAIVGLLAFPYLPQHLANVKASKEVTSPENKDRPGEYKADLMRILESPLRGAFKFPDSVKITQSKVSQSELLAANGFKATNANDRIEIWKVCGTYSAPTPLGLYGPNESFFIDATVDYLEKEIAGAVYFKTDGKWMRIRIEPDPISLTASKEDIERSIKSCDDAQPINMGSLKEFKFGYGLSHIYEDAFNRIAKNREDVTGLNACMANGDKFEDCLLHRQCVVSPDTEKCGEFTSVCTASDPVKGCVNKIREAARTKADKK